MSVSQMSCRQNVSQMSVAQTSCRPNVCRLNVLWHSISTGDSICILALGSGERLLYPSNRVRTANPVSVRVRDMVSASLSSAAVSPRY